MIDVSSAAFIFVIGNGLRWRDAPAAHGPHKMIYDGFVRRSRSGVFNRILAAKGGAPDRLMIDATHPKAHRTAASLPEKGMFRDVSGAPEAVWTPGCTRSAIVMAAPRHAAERGQMSDRKGAALMLDALPQVKALPGDRGHHADWLRHALAACMPSRINRKIHIPHDAALYRRRHRIGITFGRLKDWRRIHTRHDRCARAHRQCRHGTVPMVAFATSA